MLVVVTVVLELPTILTNELPLAATTLTSLVGTLLLCGFVGTQRVWFLRILQGGQVMSWREGWRLTWAFFGRFLVLGLFLVIPLVVWLSTALAVAHHSGSSRVAHLGWAFSGPLLGVIFIFDIAFTFAVPALSFSTTSAMTALRGGLQMIRATWPHCAYYVLTPGLLTSSLAFALPASVVHTSGAALVGLIGVILGLWFKGAIVAFYARVVPNIDETGSAYGTVRA